MPNADFNGAAPDRVRRYQLTQYNGMRWSAADAFLRPALDRENLTVITGALAHRVVFENGRAAGVQISSGDPGGETQVIRAGREVIISAGAYGSPQLLLSGVGPAADLGPFAIPCRRRPARGARAAGPPVVPGQLPH